MDMMIGSLNSYVRQVGLQAKVELKRRGGTLQSHIDPTAMPQRKTAEASMYQQMLNDEREDKDDGDKLKKIMDKIYAGKKLTGEEREYLKAKDPETYQRLKSIESDQKSYEQELKRCKTREEAQRLKMQRLNSVLTTVKSVANNPNIPEEKKRTIIAMEKLRTEKLDKTLKAFVRSGKYDKLPTEAEEAAAERAADEAKKAERTAEVEKTDGSIGEAPDEQAVREARETLEPAEEKPDAETPEERKVREAKRRAAFATAWSEDEPEEPAIHVEA